jgi:competence protein ComEC
LARRLDVRALAAPLAVPAVWAYVLFTGWQAPAVRSAVMCTLVLAGWLAGRRSDGLNALATALLLMGALDPSAPFELSVQLSFAAVLAMVLLTRPLRELVPVARPEGGEASRWRARVAGWREAALQTAVASVAVTAATAPLVLDAFQRLSLVGLLSNLVTLPLSGVLTLACAGSAAVFLAAPWAAPPVVWLAGGCAQLFLAVTRGFSALPMAAVALPAPSGWLAGLWWVGLLAGVLGTGRWRLGGLLAPAAALALVWSPPPRGLEVTFLAVGQGDSIVLSSGGHLAVVDGGGVPGGADPGQRIVVPFLKHLGARQLDLVALSHAHPDHALGLPAVLEAFPTARVWLPAAAGDGELVRDLVDAAGDARVDEVSTGAPALWLGEARVEVLAPPEDATGLATENDRSLVLRVEHGSVRFLLSGDVEAAGERLLEPGLVTVMKAPHHGSDTSSTPDLLAKARPRHVVFCVGRENRFGFPRAAVVERYRALGARCYRTDVDGAITFHSDGHDVTVETFGPRKLLDGRAGG